MCSISMLGFDVNGIMLGAGLALMAYGLARFLYNTLMGA